MARSSRGSGGSSCGSYGGRSSGGGGGGGYRRSRSASDAAKRSSSSKIKDDQERSRLAAVLHWCSNLSIDNNPFTRYCDYREEEDWKTDCGALEELHDECKRNYGTEHPLCEGYRWSMWAKDCEDCPNSGQKPSGVWYSLIKYTTRNHHELGLENQCDRYRRLYYECSTDVGDNHPACQVYRRCMINSNCDDFSGPSYIYSIENFIYNIGKRVFKEENCERLQEAYDKCKYSCGSNLCQEYLKCMSKNKCYETRKV